MRHPARTRRLRLGTGLLALGFALFGGGPSARASIHFERTLRDRSEPLPRPVARSSVMAQVSALFAAPNEACAAAFVSRFEFRGLESPGSRNQVDYCAVPVAELPPDARATIERIGESHRKVARALGLPVEEAFRTGIAVLITSFPKPGDILLGSVKSETGHLQWRDGDEDTGVGVRLQVLPNWTPAEFPDVVYAHEVVHMLTFSPGPLGEALTGLHDHPFVLEALADLVSSVANDTTRFWLGERELPESVRAYRDGTPIQSLNAPFGEFYIFRSMDRTAEACDRLDLDRESEFTRAFCRAATDGKATAMADADTFTMSARLRRKSYREDSLREPFAAEDCRVVTRSGLVYFDNCDLYRFGSTLVSFFFRLRELTGRSHLPAFVAALRAGAPRTAVYECGFADAGSAIDFSGTPMMGGGKAPVKIRPLLGAFVALREELDAAQQTSFDLAWREHGMEKLVDLDRLFRNEALAGFAQLAAKARNGYYSRFYGCTDVYALDPSRCRVTCERTR